MKRLFLAIALLMMAWAGTGVAEAATVYAKGIAGTVYFESGAASCDAVTAADTAGDLEAALTAAGASGTLNICAGTYTTTMIDAVIDAAGLLATQGAGQTINAVGSVVLDGTGVADHVLLVNHANTTINGLTLQNAGAWKADLYLNANSGGSVINDVKCLYGHYPVYGAATSGTVTLNRVEMAFAVEQVLFNAAGGTYVLNYPIIRDGQKTTYAFGAAKSSGVTVNNGLFYRNKGYSIYTHDNTSGTVTINNSIIFAPDYALASARTLYASTGSPIILNNSIAMKSANYSSQLTGGTGTVALNNVTTNKSPRFISSSKKALVSMTIDDTGNFDWFETLANAAKSSHGYPMTIAAQTSTMTSDKWARMSVLVSAGHDISSHTRHHVGLDNTDAFTIRYVGAGTAAALTVADNGHITTSITGGPGGENLDIASDNTTTLDVTCAAIDALGPYTCAVDVYRAGALSKTLADVSGQDIQTAAYIAQLDATKLYAEELDGSKADIEANIQGFTVTTLTVPNNKTGAAAQAAMLAAGYKVARGASFLSGSYDLSNLTAHNLFNVLADNLGDTEKQIQDNLVSLLEWGKERGIAVNIYSHKESEFSLDNWRTVWNVLADTSVNVMTFSDVGKHITGDLAGLLPEGATADGGLTWTRTWTDASDYRLRSGSPAINAGIAIDGLTTDFLGNPIRGLPDIGSYEYQGGSNRFPDFLNFPSFPSW